MNNCRDNQSSSLVWFIILCISLSGLYYVQLPLTQTGLLILFSWIVSPLSPPLSSRYIILYCTSTINTKNTLLRYNYVYYDLCH